MRYLSFYVTIKNDQEEKDIVIQIAICWKIKRNEHILRMIQIIY